MEATIGPHNAQHSKAVKHTEITAHTPMGKPLFGKSVLALVCEEENTKNGMVVGLEVGESEVLKHLESQS